MMTSEDIKLVQECIDIAVESGADSCRVTYSIDNENLISVLDGQIDKITSCQDNALTFYVYTKGRFGSFSTNKTDLDSIRELVKKSIPMIQMLSKDEYRKLPDPGITCHDAKNGDEMELLDREYFNQDSAERIKRALAICLKKADFPTEYKVVSEEGEYSDSIYECISADTNGMYCRHSETSYDYWVEVTIEDANGEMHSGSSWTSSPFLASFDASECGIKARDKAAAQIGSTAIKSGRYNMIVSNEVSSRFVTPLLNALNGYYLQQHNSFLENSLGRQLFPEGLTIKDQPHIKGEGGSKLFDEEGVATKEMEIIERGTVKNYFLNTYMSGKLGMDATVEDATRPVLQAWPDKKAGLKELLKRCDTGIYVTDFNGGNINTATGDFSYGIEGFYFENGRLVKPVSEMLVTGNLLSLWGSFIASGSDIRRCCVKLIPTLAFENVDFNGINK